MELIQELGVAEMMLPPAVLRNIDVYQVIKPHKLFYVGDMVVQTGGNGQCRYPFSAISSRGFIIVNYYLSPVEYFGNDRKVNLIEFPAELTELPPLHPGTQAYVVNVLRAKHT